MIPEALPHEIFFDEIELFDDIDTRVSSIGCLFPNIIGVNENYVEFCPNETPASKEEYLGWVWLNKPSLGHEIAMNLLNLLAIINQVKWINGLSTLQHNKPFKQD